MASASHKSRLNETKPSSPKKQVHKFVLDDYDATYRLAIQVLRGLCLKLTDERESNTTSKIRYLAFWFLLLNIYLSTVLETLGVITTASSGTIIDLFTMMPCVGYLFVAIAKFYKIERYKPVFINLISELREMWPEDTVTDEDHAIISSALNRLRLVTKTYFYCNLILAFIFTLPANINLIKSLFGIEVPRILPFVYWMPFDPSKKVVFEVVLIVQNIHCFLSAAYMLAGDLLFFVFLSHITTQFSLLAVRIQKMFYVPIDGQLPESYPLGYYNKENSLNNPNQDTANNRCEVEEEELKNIVIRHKALIRLSNDVENMYSFSLLVNFLNSSIIICFCLFCCAFVEKWNEFNYKIFFITAISQIWILCWYGQHLVDTSTGVGEALYNSAWYVSSNSIKKSILIMIHRSQRRVHITTFGFSTVSMECYATILKTSWSYFTLLINLYNT